MGEPTIKERFFTTPVGFAAAAEGQRNQERPTKFQQGKKGAGKGGGVVRTETAPPPKKVAAKKEKLRAKLGSFKCLKETPEGAHMLPVQ